jgi:8-oxo-dGTP diphosphatase
MQTHHVCVGAIIVKRGQVLLGHRSPNRAFYPDVWDVFGGHVEVNEKAEDALIRELKEEVGVEPTEWSYLETITTVTGEDVVECRYYVVTDWHGALTNRQPEEHSVIQWFSLESALSLELAHRSYLSLFARAMDKYSPKYPN